MKINILLTLDKKYLQHLNVMLVSLFENNKNNSCNVYIFSDDLESKDKEIILNLVTFYQQKVVFNHIDIDTMKKFPVTNHISLATYYRILALSLLPSSIDKILYLDLDILVLKNIDNLYQTKIENKLLGIIREPANMEIHKMELKIPKEHTYFNAGVMLVNITKWQAENWTEKLITYIAGNPEKITFWDQDALNAMCHGQCVYLEQQWNMQAAMFENNKNGQENFKNTAIMHFTGASKPWQYMNNHPYKHLYYQYLKKTIFKNFVPPDKTIGNFLRKYKLMPKWYERLFKK